MGNRCDGSAAYIAVGLMFLSLGLYMGWRELRFFREGVPAKGIWRDASQIPGLSAEFFEFTDAEGNPHKIQQMFFTLDPLRRRGSLIWSPEEPYEILLDGDSVDIEYLRDNPDVARRRFKDMRFWNYMMALGFSIAGLSALLQPVLEAAIKRKNL